MNYYKKIKNKIIDNEVYSKIKDYSKEKHKVLTYFEIGKLLTEAGGKYGDNIIEEYSKKLVVEVGKKYNKRTLYRMKQLYIIFNNEKVSTAWTQLTWSHLRLLFGLNYDSINYYIKIIINKHISVRELEHKLKNNEYERLPIETKNKLTSKEKIEIKDLIPNPIIIKSNLLSEKINEYTLKQLILNNLDKFLIQLGNSFAYIGNEYKIKVDGKYNYIDLLLFNYEYNCFVVIELKVTELKKEHIGQIQIYMNYIDENLKSVTQDKTIGIIICKKNEQSLTKRNYLLKQQICFV